MTKVLSYSLTVEPSGHFINWQQDPFSNYQARLVFPEPTRAFKLTVDRVVEMAVFNPFDFFLEPDAEEFPFKYSKDQGRELAPYLATEPATPLLQAYLDSVDRTPKRTIDFLVGLNQKLQGDIVYAIRMAPGVQTPEETLKLGIGSCRDTGWLMERIHAAMTYESESTEVGPPHSKRCNRAKVFARTLPTSWSLAAAPWVCRRVTSAATC